MRKILKAFIGSPINTNDPHHYTRPDRHEGFRKHYPDGYRMDFIGEDEVKTHAGLKAAYKLNQEKAKASA